MKIKSVLRYICVTTMLVSLVTFKHDVHVSATEIAGASVTVFIESFDRNMARENVNAFTFEEAVVEADKKNGLNVVYRGDGKSKQIYSINGVEEGKFGGSDGWYGYILRNGGLIKPDDYLKLSLEPDDKVVLFYGDKENTSIATDFTLTKNNGNVTFSINTAKTNWVQGLNGQWKQENVVVGLEDVKIRVQMPDGSQKVLKTDENGLSITQFDATGFYSYYAEHYVNGCPPMLVRTDNYTYLYGIENENAVKRGEAIAFLVNHFNIEGGVIEKKFSDVDSGARHNREIGLAVSAGLVSGYDDGTFHPDEPMTMLQLCVVLSAILPGEAHENEKIYEGVPEWAAEKVSKVMSSGVIGTVSDWEGFVGYDVLFRLYSNK